MPPRIDRNTGPAPVLGPYAYPRQANFAGAVQRARAAPPVLPALPIRAETTTLITTAVQYDQALDPDKGTSRTNWNAVRTALADELRQTVKTNTDESGKLDLKPEDQARLQLVNGWAAGTDRLAHASREALADIDTEMRQEQLGKTIDQIEGTLKKVRSTVDDHSLLHQGWDFVTGGGAGDDFENFLQGKLDKLNDLRRKDEAGPMSQQAYAVEIKTAMDGYDSEFKRYAEDFQDSEETWNTIDEVGRVVVATTVGIAATAISMNPAIGIGAGMAVGAAIGTGAAFLTYEGIDAAGDVGDLLDGKDMYADGHSSLIGLGVDALGGGSDGFGVSGDHLKSTLKDTAIDAVSSLATGGATAGGIKVSAAMGTRLAGSSLPALLQQGIAAGTGGTVGQVVNGTGQLTSEATRLAFDEKLFTAEGGDQMLKALTREGINLAVAPVSGVVAGIIPVHRAIPAATAADDAVPAATAAAGRTAAGTGDDLAAGGLTAEGLADDIVTAGTGTGATRATAAATMADDLVAAGTGATGTTAAAGSTAATGAGTSATTGATGNAAGTVDDVAGTTTGAATGTTTTGTPGSAGAAPSALRLSVPGLTAQFGNDLAVNLGGAELAALATEGRHMNKGEIIAASLGAVPGTAMNIAMRPKMPDAASLRQSTAPGQPRVTDPPVPLTLREPLAGPDAPDAPVAPAAAARAATGQRQTAPEAPAIAPSGRLITSDAPASRPTADGGRVPASREVAIPAPRAPADSPVEIRVSRLLDESRAVTTTGRTVGAHELVMQHDRGPEAWRNAHIILDVREPSPHAAAFARKVADAAGVDVLHPSTGRGAAGEPGLQRVAPTPAAPSTRTLQVAEGRAFLVEADGSRAEIEIGEHLGRRVDAGPRLTAFAVYDKVVAFPRDGADVPDATPIRAADAAAARAAGLPVLGAGDRVSVFQRPAVIYDGNAVALRDLIIPAGGRQVMLDDTVLNAASLASIRQIREVLAGRPVDPATGRPVPVERFALVVMRDGRIALVDPADPRAPGRTGSNRLGVEMLDDLERGIRAKLARDADAAEGRSLDAIEPVQRDGNRRGRDPRRDQPEDEQADDGVVTPIDFRRASARAAALAELDMDRAAAPPNVGDDGTAPTDRAGGEGAVRPAVKLSPAEIERNRQDAAAIFERIAPQSLRMPEMTIADLVDQCARSPELMRLIGLADQYQVRLVNAAHPDLAVLGHDQKFTIASYTRRLELISLDPSVLRDLLKDFPGGDTYFIPEMTRNFAHELAHAVYEGRPPPSRDFDSLEAFAAPYVQAQLTDEGHSRLTEYIVSNELEQNGGRLPPRVARHSADREVFARYKAGELTREEAAREMGELFRTQPRDVSGKTYGETFAEHAATIWNQRSDPAQATREDGGEAAPAQQRYRAVMQGDRWVIHNPDGSVRETHDASSGRAAEAAEFDALRGVTPARTDPTSRPPASSEPIPADPGGPPPPRQRVHLGGRLGLDEPAPDAPAAPPPGRMRVTRDGITPADSPLPARGAGETEPAVDAGRPPQQRADAAPQEIRFSFAEILDGAHAVDPAGRRVSAHESLIRSGLGDQLFAWRSPDTAFVLDVAAPGPHLEAFGRTLATALGRDVTIRPPGGTGEPVTVAPGTPRRDGTVEFTGDGIVLTDAAGRRVLAPEEVPEHLGRVWVSQNAIAVQLHDQVVVLPHRPDAAPAMIREQQHGLDVLRRMGVETLDADPATLFGLTGLASRRGTGFDQISAEVPVFDAAAGTAYSRFEVHDDAPLTAATIASVARQRAAIERIIAEGPADPGIGRTTWVQDPDLVIMPDGTVRFRDPEGVVELPHAYRWERELNMLAAVETAARAKLPGETAAADGEAAGDGGHPRQPQPRNADRIPVGRGNVVLHGEADARALMDALQDGRLAADGDAFIYKFHNRWQAPDTGAPATLRTAQLRDWAHVPEGTGDALVVGRVRAGERWFLGDPELPGRAVFVVSRDTPGQVDAAGGFAGVDWAPRAETRAAEPAPLLAPELQFGRGVPPTHEQQAAADALMPAVQARLDEQAARPKPRDLSAAHQDPDAPLPPGNDPASRIPPALRGSAVPDGHGAGHDAPGRGIDRLPRRVPADLSSIRYLDQGDVQIAGNESIDAYARIELESAPGITGPLPDGVYDSIVVTHIQRGGLPPGSGLRLLNDLLDHAGATPHRHLVFHNIHEERTLGSFGRGEDPADSVLGRMGAAALRARGVEPESYIYSTRQGKDGPELDLIIRVRQPAEKASAASPDAPAAAPPEAGPRAGLDAGDAALIDAIASRADPAFRERLVDLIHSQGRISFRDFMHHSLNGIDGEGGYYNSGRAEIGPQNGKSVSEPDGGDFMTAPEHSPYFGYSVARSLADMHEAMGRPTRFEVVEMGAGNGSLAHSIIARLRDYHPEVYAALRYRIVERNRGLIERQRQALQGEPVDWIHGSAETMPLRGVKGVFLSNELPDAFPVHRVVERADGLKEIYVTVDPQGRFVEVEGEPSPRLAAAGDVLDRLVPDRSGLPEGQQYTVNLQAADWMRRLGAALDEGYVLTIDYGLPSAALRAPYAFYKKQLPIDAAYRAPGAVDITSMVDFVHLMEVGRDAGLMPSTLPRAAPLEPQRSFLQKNGFEDAFDFASGVKELKAATELLHGYQTFLVMVQQKRPGRTARDPAPASASARDGGLPPADQGGAVPLPRHLQAQAETLGRRIEAQLAEEAARPKPKDLSAAHHDPDAPIPRDDPASRIPPALRGGPAQPADDPVAAARAAVEQARALLAETEADAADRAIVDAYSAYLEAAGAADPHGAAQIGLDMTRLIEGWGSYRQVAAEQSAQGGTGGAATAREALLQGMASRAARAEMIAGYPDLLSAPVPAPHAVPALAVPPRPGTPRRQALLIDRDPRRGPLGAVDLPPELAGDDVLPVALAGQRTFAQDTDGGLIPEATLAQEIAAAPFHRPDGTRLTLDDLAGDPGPLPKILLVMDEAGAPAAGGLTPYAQSLVDALATRLGRDDVRVAAQAGPSGEVVEYAPRPAAQRLPSLKVRQADIAWNGQILHGVPRGAFAVEAQIVGGMIQGDIYQQGGLDIRHTPEAFAAYLRGRDDYRAGQPVMLLGDNGRSVAEPLAAALGAAVIATDGKLPGGRGLADERSWTRDDQLNAAAWTITDPPAGLPETAAPRPAVPLPDHLQGPAEAMGQRVADRLAEDAARPKPRDLSAAHHDPDAPIPPAGDPASRIPPALRGQAAQPEGDPAGAVSPAARSASSRADVLPLLHAQRDVLSPLCFDLSGHVEAIRAAPPGDRNAAYDTLAPDSVLRIPLSDSYRDGRFNALDLLPAGLSARDRLAFLDTVRTSRELGEDNPLRRLDTGQAEELLIGIPDRDVLLVPSGTIHVPVGTYGARFSFDLLRATGILTRVARDRSAVSALGIRDRDPELMRSILADEFRFRDDLEGPYNTPLANLQEGIVAVADGIWLTMAESTGAPREPMQALRALVEQRILEEIALRFGLGVLAPMRLRGQFIRDLVVWTDGVPRLNPELMPEVHRQKQAQARGTTEDAALDGRPVPALGVGCPVAHPVRTGDRTAARQASGVQALSEALLHVMDDLSARRGAGYPDALPAVVRPEEDLDPAFVLLPRDVTPPELFRDLEGFEFALEQAWAKVDPTLDLPDIELIIRAGGSDPISRQARVVHAARQWKSAEFLAAMRPPEELDAARSNALAEIAAWNEEARTQAADHGLSAFDPLRHRTEADVRRAAERTAQPALPPMPPLDLGGAVPLPAHLQAQAEEMGRRIAARLAEEAARPRPQDLSAAFHPPGPPPPPPGLTDLKTKQGPPTGGDERSLKKLEAGIEREFAISGPLDGQLAAEGVDGTYHPAGHWQEVAELSPALLGVMADAGASARDTGRRDNATLAVQTTKMAAGNRGLFGNDIDHSGATVYTGMNVPKSRRAWPSRVVQQVADEFRALFAENPERAARVDPQLRLDPTNPKGDQLLREQTLRNPGVFAAAGAELMRGPLTTLLGRKGFRFQTTAQREALKGTIKRAQEIGYPVFLRSNAGEVKLGHDGRPQESTAAYDKQFDGLKALLDEVGKDVGKPVVVNDLCLDVFVRPDLKPEPLTLPDGTVTTVPRHVARMEELLHDRPGVRLTIGEHSAHAITRSPELRAALVDFVARHPDSVLFESGMVMPLNPGMYNRTATTMLPFVADLARRDPDLGWAFIRGNYEGMIDAGRENVRLWTRALLPLAEAAAPDAMVKMLQGHQATASGNARTAYDSWVGGLPPAPPASHAATTVPRPDTPKPTDQTAEHKHRVGTGTGWGSHTRGDVAAVASRVVATLGVAAGSAVAVATFVPSRILAVASGMATAIRALVGQRRTLTQQFNRLSWWRMTVDGQVGEKNFAINVDRMVRVARDAGVDAADIRQVLWEAGQARADIAHLQHGQHLTDVQKTDAIKARMREFDHAVTRALGIGTFSLDPIDVRTARGRRFSLADAGTNLVNMMSVAASPFRGVIDAVANHAPSLFGRAGGIVQNVIGFFSGRRNANLVDRNTGLRIPLKLGGTWLTPAAAGTLGARDGMAAVEAALRGSYGEAAFDGVRFVSDALLTWFAARAAHNDSRVLLRFSRPIEIRKENLQLTVSWLALAAGGVAVLTPIVTLAFEDDDPDKQPTTPPSPKPSTTTPPATSPSSPPASPTATPPATTAPPSPTMTPTVPAPTRTSRPPTTFPTPMRTLTSQPPPTGGSPTP